MTEEEKTLLIERYLKGELPDAERQEVERMIETDAQFAAEVSVIRLMLDTLEDRDLVQFHRRITEAWDAEEEDEDEDNKDGSPDNRPSVGPDDWKGRSNRRYWILAAALLFVLIVIGLWKYYQAPLQQLPVINTQDTPPQQKPTPPLDRDSVVKPPPVRPQAQNTGDRPNPKYIALAKSNYGAAPDFSSLRGGTDNIPIDSLPPLLRAERAFAGKQYKKVIQLLARPGSGVLESATYLRGHAYFNTGNYAAAAKDFSVVADMKKQDADDAGWYLLLSNLALYGPGNETVRRQLDAIAGDSGHPHVVEAKKLQVEIGQ